MLTVLPHLGDDENIPQVNVPQTSFGGCRHLMKDRSYTKVAVPQELNKHAMDIQEDISAFMDKLNKDNKIKIEAREIIIQGGTSIGPIEKGDKSKHYINVTIELQYNL